MDKIKNELHIVWVDPNKLHTPLYCVFWSIDRLEEIKNLSLPFVLENGKLLTPIEFSIQDDIPKALSENRYDNRSFQACQNELWQEWNIKSGGDLRLFVELCKNYHIERIAYFVSHSEDLEAHPLHIKSDQQSLWDGLHRVWAAIYLGRSEIKAYIFENKEDSDNWHKENSI